MVKNFTLVILFSFHIQSLFAQLFYNNGADVAVMGVVLYTLMEQRKMPADFLVMRVKQP